MLRYQIILLQIYTHFELFKFQNVHVQTHFSASDQMDFGLIKQPTTGGLSSTSPRMRRFAERLAVIQISLDPPSPPEFALQSPDENSGRAPVPFWAQPGYENYFRPIEDSLLLQVCVVLV